MTLLRSGTLYTKGYAPRSRGASTWRPSPMARWTWGAPAQWLPSTTIDGPLPGSSSLGIGRPVARRGFAASAAQSGAELATRRLLGRPCQVLRTRLRNPRSTYIGATLQFLKQTRFYHNGTNVTVFGIGELTDPETRERMRKALKRVQGVVKNIKEHVQGRPSS